MSDLIDKEIGAEGGVKLSIVEGKIKLEVMYDGKGVDGSIAVMLEAGYFMDKLKDVIPGEIDDAVIEVIKAALSAQK